MRKTSRWVVYLGISFFALVVVGLSLSTLPGQNYYNPYTGKKKPQANYNPFTGRGTPNKQSNPFTGRLPQQRINPYTGRPIANAPPNPLTNPGSSPQYSSGPGSIPQGKLPVTGKSGPGLDSLDRAILGIMNRHGIPGASLSVSKDGKLVYAKGFGWSHLEKGKKVLPETLFGLASLSKPITAIAVLLLIERGLLRLDDRVMDIIGHIRPPKGIPVQEKLKKVTIRQLLNHTGGWDRRKAGDPADWQPQIARALNKPIPLSEKEFISFMMGVELDFEPGTQNVYSNVGYIMLGEVIAKVSGESYEDFIRKNVLQPSGIQQELFNASSRNYTSNEAHRYLAGSLNPLPPMNLPMVQAAAGWSISSVDMVRFLSTLDGSRGKGLLKQGTYRLMLTAPPDPVKPRKDGSYNGLGWPSVKITEEGFMYSHDGSFHGMRTFARHKPNGVNWALMFNISMTPDALDSRILQSSVKEIRQQVDLLKNYPDVDYFDEFK